MTPCTLQKTSYNPHVSSKKGLIGFGSPFDSGDKPQPHSLRLFHFVPQFMVARMGGRKPCRFSSAVAGLPTCSSHRPRLEASALVFKTDSLEANMAHSPARRTAPHIAVIDGQPTTTSRDIAETFGKEHRVVLLRIRDLNCSEEFRVHNFVQTLYTDPQNKQEYTEYRITRDGFAFLCMGFTGAKAAQWKERYIHTFNKMADKLAGKAAQGVRGKVRTPTPAPELPAPSLLGRRWLVSYDGTGKEQVTPLAAGAAVVNPSNPDELAAFLHDMVPQHLLGEALATLTGRTLSLLNHRQRETAAAAGKPLQISPRTPT